MVLKRRKKPVKAKQMVKRPSNLWKRSRFPCFRSKEDERLAYKESAEIDPFEAKGYTIRFGYRDLWETKCNDRSPCPTLVLLYARMGLHRHNLLKGTNYELVRVMKFNKTIPIPCASSYYITSVAKDPSSSSSLIFRTGVDEKGYGRFILTCDYARPRGTTDTPRKSEFFLAGDLPECPPQNPFRSSNPFYLLKKSEWQDNAWISLYLELAVATTHRGRGDRDLSNLKIVKVAMEDVNEERLNAKNAVFYIRYKDSYEARVGKDVDRIAIVKRAFNDRTGCFSLVGRNQSSGIIPKNDKIRSAQLLFSRRLGVLKPWRLSSPRRRKAFKNRVLGRLHKTRQEPFERLEESRIFKRRGRRLSSGKSEKIRMTNEKGLLSQEETEWMVKESEEDKKMRESIEAYVYNMKNRAAERTTFNVKRLISQK